MQFKFCVFTYYFHGIKLIFPLQVPFYLSMSDRKPTAQFLFWPELSAHPTRLARYFQTTRPFWHVTYNVPEGPGVVASFRRMRTYRNRPVWHATPVGTRAHGRLPAVGWDHKWYYYLPPYWPRLYKYWRTQKHGYQLSFAVLCYG